MGFFGGKERGLRLTLTQYVKGIRVIRGSHVVSVIKAIRFICVVRASRANRIISVEIFTLEAFVSRSIEALMAAENIIMTKRRGKEA